MKSDSTNIDFLKGEKSNPFLIPEGYFSESRARIMDRIGTEASISPSRLIKLKTRVMWLSGIAASLLVGFLLFQNLYIKPQHDIRIAQELNWFISSAGSELNEVSLASYMVDEGISFDDFDDPSIEAERSNLLEMTDYDELFIIEEWMKIEDQ